MRLTENDASFLYTETASGPMHTAVVYVVDGELPFEKVHAHFAARMHLVPRYLQKLALVPFNLAHPKWVDASPTTGASSRDNAARMTTVHG